MFYRLGDKCHECQKFVLAIPHNCSDKNQVKFIPNKIYLTLGAVEDIDRHLGIKQTIKKG